MCMTNKSNDKTLRLDPKYAMYMSAQTGKPNTKKCLVSPVFIDMEESVWKW